MMSIHNPNHLMFFLLILEWYVIRMRFLFWVAQKGVFPIIWLSIGSLFPSVTNDSFINLKRTLWWGSWIFNSLKKQAPTRETPLPPICHIISSSSSAFPLLHELCLKREYPVVHKICPTDLHIPIQYKHWARSLNLNIAGFTLCLRTRSFMYSNQNDSMWKSWWKYGFC